MRIFFFTFEKEDTTPWSLLDLLVPNEMLITASDKQCLSKVLLFKLGKKTERRYGKTLTLLNNRSKR